VILSYVYMGLHLNYPLYRCPTRYRTRHFFNNSNTNEDIATKFVYKYVRCVRNEEECVCSVCLFRCNILIGFRIIKEMPGSVASATPCTFQVLKKTVKFSRQIFEEKKILTNRMS